MLRPSDLRVLPCLASSLVVGLAFPGAVLAADAAADDERRAAEVERDWAEKLAKPDLPSCTEPDPDDCGDGDDQRSLAALLQETWRAAFVRGSLEYSRPNVPFNYTGELVGEGLSTTFYDRGSTSRDAVGGRLETGVAFSMNDWLFLLPHAAFTLAWIDTIVRQVDVAGVSQSWTSNPMWWAGMVGMELQIYRWVGLSVDIGMGGIADYVSSPRPIDLRLTSTAPVGVLGKLALNVHLPVSERFGAGVTGAVEGFTSLDVLTLNPPTAAGRACLGIFIEWDQSRKAGRHHDP